MQVLGKGLKYFYENNMKISANFGEHQRSNCEILKCDPTRENQPNCPKNQF